MRPFRSSLAALFAAAIVLTLVDVSRVSAAAIGAGNIVVIRVGDGATTATGTALPVTLDEYSVTYTGTAPTGVTLVQSIPLPTGALGTAPSSGQRYLAQGGTAGGEGGLALSSNGLYMTLAGYNSGLGDPTNAGTVGTEDRVVGRLDLATGVCDTSTVLVGFAATSAIRNAFTTNGTDIWTATSTGGVRYTTFGNTAGAGTALTSTGNERRVQVYNNQLYTSRMSGTVDGVATVGTGTPTSGTQTVTLLPGLPTATNSIYDYFFADANTLYMVDDRGAGNGGVEKWILSGGTWTQAFNVQVNPGAGNVGVKSLAGSVDASGNVVLFGSTTGAQGNFLYGFSDTLTNTNVANVTSTQLVNSGTAFTGSLWGLRGVAIAPVPEPGSLAVLALLAAPVLAGRRRRN
jgi:hypothetical protein